MRKQIANRKNVEPEMEYQVANALAKNGHEVLVIGIRDDLRDMSARLGDWKPDLVFNATEAFLENSNLDYLVPALLEAEGYRYTGAPPLALLVTRNKSMSKKVVAYHGIKVPEFRSYRVGEAASAADGLRFPVIVKPLASDASEGISQASIVHDATALAERVAWVHERFSQPAIAEEYIEGRELYATMIGNGDNVQILPIVEMTFEEASTRPEERIATQYAKWDMGYRKRRGIKNVFARPLPKAAKQRLTDACLFAYRAFWLRDYARIDVRLTKDNEIWFIEANANPFLSYGHDSAEAAHKAGLRYNAFIQRIVDDAMARQA
jgi:D-alanine-D-alanine ligase